MRGRAKHDGIDAVAFGPRADFVEQTLLAENDHLLRAHRFAKRFSGSSQVHSHDAAAIGAQETRHEQPDEALAHHEHAVAQGSFELPH